MALSHPSQLLAADLQARFRPQREWVQGRAVFLILAHFLSGAGAGAWLFSVLGAGKAGLVVGWVLVALGGLAHLLFLGRPSRFWRMIARPGSSWISRGLLGMTFFLFAGGLFLALDFLQQGRSQGSQWLWWVSLLGAAWVVAYKGFVWASAKGIPLWNTPLLPALYIAYGLRGGLAVLLLIALVQVDSGDPLVMETVKLWLGVSSTLLVLMYLSVMRGTGLTAARSVQVLLSGSAAPVFYAGAVVLGLVVPISLGGYALVAHVGPALLAVVSVASLAGDLAIIYAIARAGLYRPLPA